MTTKQVTIEVRTFEGMTEQEIKAVTKGIMIDRLTSEMAGIERTPEQEAVMVYELSTIKDILYSRKNEAGNENKEVDGGNE